jgi:hypothetical protein
MPVTTMPVTTTSVATVPMRVEVRSVYFKHTTKKMGPFGHQTPILLVSEECLRKDVQ